VHVYYYNPDKDGLILDAIRPLYTQLRSRVDALYLTPHWRQGPHLRLFAKTDPDTWAQVVRPRIDSLIGDYLAAHPSTTEPDVDRELAQHRLLAQRERELGPLTPWFPDNSIHEQPPAPRSHVLPSAETRELVNAFAADGTPVLFQMLERVRAAEDVKELLALELMLATSVTAMPPITASFASYRSHAEGFLHSCGDPAAVRVAFDAHYDARREALVDRTRAVLATLDGTADTALLARQWADLCQEYGHRVAPLIQRGLVFPPPTSERPAPTRAPMHELMFGNRAYREAVFENEDFLRYRFLLNCTYQQVNRLGLTPYERLRTCHATANAVEEIHDISAIDLIHAFVERNPDLVTGNAVRQRT
jgi:AcrR family transcriptional regulator